MNIDQELQERVREEQELQFEAFTNRTALEIGLKLAERAQKERKAITIDITRSGQQLFHYACEGTTPDNDQWIIRKCRVVNRFHKSSLRVGQQLVKSGTTIDQRYYVNPLEYSAHGGAFPILIRNVGVVGTIAVSGLAQEEDHAMVVEAIRQYLKAL
ncbi:uncharacterized protein (UPF0303 family) [Hydrogenispora ethanolica]|uniref:UPF0303 protein EDC14_1005111 n=1 Tax=Hydrogenispora ethanolica TaxID=1082276 RepID=A0A4R1S2K0_HYDET|nr:heme-degrading domain-containing protein [Hydrogenispora ethanolica]TCL73249.1 uncharacterized protein (UPF0303 family) [Hydrogenispora ethanolica]